MVLDPARCLIDSEGADAACRGRRLPRAPWRLLLVLGTGPEPRGTAVRRGDHVRGALTARSACACRSGSPDRRPTSSPRGMTAMARTRHESSVTAISWIPSEAIEGLSKVPFELGVTHYDQPPPDQIDGRPRGAAQDRPLPRGQRAAGVHRRRGRPDRRLRATSAAARSASTTVRLGPAAIRFAAVHLPDLQKEPEVGPTSVRFVQTVGGRMGIPTPRPVKRRPFVQFWPSIAWSTLELTINADGTSSRGLAGASPFPRHWVYDEDGRAHREVRPSSTSGPGRTTASATARRGARTTRSSLSRPPSRRSSVSWGRRSCAAA